MINPLYVCTGYGIVMNLAATHYNCTSPMDYISHHTLHSHIPIHHHTNHTAVTNHSFALMPHHTCTSFTHSHLSSTHTLTLCEVLFSLANISERSSYSSCYRCVSPRTAWPWISEPVPVTPTSAWYCLQSLPCLWYSCFCLLTLPVWFCLLILLQVDPLASDHSLQVYRPPGHHTDLMILASILIMKKIHWD